METVKEKLNKLIHTAADYSVEMCERYVDCNSCPHFGDSCYAMTDYLIQNGVTILECGMDCKNCWKTKIVNPVQEWVSVDERLPEFVKVEKYGDLGNIAKSVRVLCSCLQKDGKQMVKEGYCQRWLDGSGAVWWKIPGTINKVTHWMPLPEPPKGVQ